MDRDRFITVKDDKEGYIDLFNQVYIEPIYNSLRIFTNDNMIIANLNGKYGILNLLGETIVEHKYTDIKYSNTNMPLMVENEQKFGFINRNGNRM